MRWKLLLFLLIGYLIKEIIEYYLTIKSIQKKLNYPEYFYKIPRLYQLFDSLYFFSEEPAFWNAISFANEFCKQLNYIHLIKPKLLIESLDTNRINCINELNSLKSNYRVTDTKKEACINIINKELIYETRSVYLQLNLDFNYKIIVQPFNQTQNINFYQHVN